ncbi:hypothetical protein ACFSTH_02980 [Paenibacillus yanchengensis]|uniref:Uncharacterized protein n=1 Tax=Paenibacillus yanchengensis TaxID=2035833 RepID=A0ABW4YGF5_9BACL
MKRKNKVYLLWTLIFVVVMCVGWFSLYTLHSYRSNVSKQLSEKNNQLLEETSIDLQQMMNEQSWRIWERENQTFLTHTQQAVLLFQNNEMAIYVANNELYYVTIDAGQTILSSPVTLFAWEKDTAAQAWVNGEYLVIGGKASEEIVKEDEQLDQGIWITIKLDIEPELVSENIRNYYPEQIWNATFLEGTDSLLFQMKFDHKKYLRTIIHDPQVAEWLYADSHLLEEWMVESAAQTKDVRLLAATTRYTLTDNQQVLVYEDGQSTFLQQNNIIRKYEQFQLANASSISRYDQSVTLLGHFKRTTGEQLHIIFGDELYFPYEPRLMKGEWFMLPTFNFIQMNEQYIHVLNYEAGLQLDSLSPTYKRIAMDGVRYVGQQGSLAIFHPNLEVAQNDGAEMYANLLDLANSSETSIRPLLATKIAEPQIKKVSMEGMPQEWSQHPIADSPLTHDFSDENANDEIPEAILSAINETFRPSDYSFSKAIRRLDKEWYVLYEQQLYQYNNDTLEEVTRLPITILSTIGEAVGGYGAKDYLKHKEHWYIADTEGNRVIQLNEQWKVLATLETNKPSKLTKYKDQLKITGLTTETIVDWNLNVQSSQQQSYTTAKLNGELHGFKHGEWWEDKEQGRIWYYIQGYLHQFNTNTQQHREIYIGHLHNNLAQAHIWLAGEQVMVMLDQQLHRFERNGIYIDTIYYPRSNPDGIYDTNVEGEGTMVWDEETNIVYIVQGYRILAISLTTGGVTDIFNQNYADIGTIQLVNNNISFMLRSYIEERYLIRLPHDDQPDLSFYTEIVEIDKVTLDQSRYVVEGYSNQLLWTELEVATPIFVMPTIQ